LAGRSTTGSCRTSAAKHKFAQRRPVRYHRQSTFESRKARSLDWSCFSCTLPTCCSLWSVIISRRMLMQTTPRSMDIVSRLTLAISLNGLPSASTRLQRGWRQIDCNWIWQDRGPLVRLIPTSTLSPDCICSCRCCFCVTGHCCAGSWRLHRQWCHHEDSRHQYRPIVLLGTAPDPELRRSLPQHALLTLVHDLVITKLDHCNSLLVSTAGSLAIPAKLAAVCAERRRSAYLLSPGVRTHDPTAPGPSLATRTGANPVSYHCLHSTAPAYLADSLRPTSEVVPFAVYALPTQRRCRCRQLSG